ncbi:MAG: hypothetical protein H8F28_20820, partial [Fibrella sp.]|nr:hypothetical protein [Armatimonadota bacterium]
MRKSTLVKMAWATLGMATVGVTALPLVSVWQQQDVAANSFATVSTLAQTAGEQPTSIVVDLRDNVSPAAIEAIERRIGAELDFASPYAVDDKMMVATLPSASAAQTALSRLAGDGRVEVAEEEMLLRIPEMSAQDSIEMQAVAVAEASRQSVESAKAEALAAAEQSGYALPEDSSSSFEVGPLSCGLTGQSGVDLQKPYTLHVENRSFAVDNTGRWMFEPVRTGRVASLDTEINKPGGTRPNDPMYDQQWNFKMVGAEDAWKKTRGKGAIVAVIDTGVAAESTKKGKQCKDFNT